MKRRVLFLCATNGVHSPMAEALLERIDSQNFEAQSAGTSCGRLHPCAVEVMNEIGIDLRAKTPRPVQALSDAEFDYVIALDDSAAGRCRDFQFAETVHWKIDDPIARSKSPQQQLREFRMVRDQIAQRLRLFVIVHVRPQNVSVPTTQMASAAMSQV